MLTCASYTLSLQLKTINIRSFPLELSIAQRLFAKVLLVVTAHLHQMGIAIFPYPDWILKGGVFSKIHLATDTDLALFHSLDLHLNTEKSSLTPIQHIDFIGATLDSIMGRHTYPQTGST